MGFVSVPGEVVLTDVWRRDKGVTDDGQRRRRAAAGGRCAAEETNKKSRAN